MTIVGFTGTREAMFNSQNWALMETLQTLRTVSSELHHGGCKGADEVAHNLAMKLGFKIEVHPSDLAGYQGLRAFASKVHPAKPALKRNHDIVSACDVLVAVVKGPEELRSGTWATIRYARKAKKPIIIIWPFGSPTVEIRKG